MTTLNEVRSLTLKARPRDAHWSVESSEKTAAEDTTRVRASDALHLRRAMLRFLFGPRALGSRRARVTGNLLCPWNHHNSWVRTKWIILSVYLLVGFLIIWSLVAQSPTSERSRYGYKLHRHSHRFNEQFRQGPPLRQQSDDQKDELNDNEIDEFTRSMEHRMQQRRNLVKDVCRKNGIGQPVDPKGPKIEPAFKHPPTPQYSVFYFIIREDNLNLSWCPIYKSGSTSWLHIFSNLAGVDEEYIQNSGKQISEIARAIYPSIEAPEAKEILANSDLRFLIVRHPFIRLLSAYRDKLEDMRHRHEDGTEYFYRSYGRKIVQKYRQHTEQHQRDEPTFPEFVQYLIDTDSVYFDDHWMPYYLFCTPCLVNYDVIMKLETVDEDQRYLLVLAGLDEEFWPDLGSVVRGLES
ncbi:unnamed protein product [Cyprideis torosa]|uniref:Carbohydrate sulfotransferase n=1 Tax=Cyprideis torosa TaxID=163714 RepID=A0A7R8ZJR5_9CRUS|nr:unnamed protein product [Cyprideis torosa]CAG0889053.1 unnamed protein product [Cyprideis torosa]